MRMTENRGTQRDEELASLADVETRLKEVENQLRDRKKPQKQQLLKPQAHVVSEIWSAVLTQTSERGGNDAVSQRPAEEAVSAVAMATCCEKAIGILRGLMEVAARLDEGAGHDSGVGGPISMDEMCARTTSVLAAEEALLSLPTSSPMHGALSREATRIRRFCRDWLLGEGAGRLLCVEEGQVSFVRPRRACPKTAVTPATYVNVLRLIERAGGSDHLGALARAVSDRLLSSVVDPLFLHGSTLMREVREAGGSDVVILVAKQSPSAFSAHGASQHLIEAVEQVLTLVVRDALEGVHDWVMLFKSSLITPLLQRLVQRVGQGGSQQEEQEGVARVLGVLDGVIAGVDGKDHLLASLAKADPRCRQQRAFLTDCLSIGRHLITREENTPPVEEPQDEEDLWRAIVCAEGKEEDESPLPLRAQASRDLLAWLVIEKTRQPAANKKPLWEISRKLEAIGHRSRRLGGRESELQSPYCWMDLSSVLREAAVCTYASGVEKHLAGLLQGAALAQWAAPRSSTGDDRRSQQSLKKALGREVGRAAASEVIIKAVGGAQETLAAWLPPDAVQRAGICLVDAVMLKLVDLLPVDEEEEEDRSELLKACHALDQRCLQAVQIPQEAVKLVERPWHAVLQGYLRSS